MVGWGTSYHGRNIQQMYSFHCKYSRQMLLPHTQFIYIRVYSLTLSGMHRITALCTMHTRSIPNCYFLFFLVMVLFFYRIIRLHAVQYNLVSNQNTHEINTQQRKKTKKKENKQTQDRFWYSSTIHNFPHTIFWCSGSVFLCVLQTKMRRKHSGVSIMWFGSTQQMNS